jgi:hypothetical protein
MVFHVLNRGIARMQMFEKTGDYEAFERTLCETLQEVPKDGKGASRIYWIT